MATEKDQREYREFKIKWPTETGTAQYTNNAVCQLAGDPGLLLLTFFQVTPPPIVGSVEEQQKQIESIPAIEAKPVAKLLMAREHAKAVVKLLQKHIGDDNERNS